MKEVIIKPKKQKNRGKETRRTEDFAEAEIKGIRTQMKEKQEKQGMHTEEGEEEKQRAHAEGETEGKHRRS